MNRYSFTATVIIAGIVIGLFYLLLSWQKDYAERCRQAGGAPLIGQGVMTCLKRDMVVQPVQ